MKVALLDHAGADIIAADLKNRDNRYAISVKSRTLSLNKDKMSIESKMFHFDRHNVEELRSFAENFQLRPDVAIVCAQPAVEQNKAWQEKLAIDVFIYLLDDAFAMINEGKSYFGQNKREPGGLNFRFENRYFKEILDDKHIDHIRLSFDDTLKPFRLWDPLHPMDNDGNGASDSE